MTRYFLSGVAVFGLLLGLSLVSAKHVEAATFKVNCDKGGPSIQDRLDNNVKPRDTIEISGTECVENVVIVISGVTLRSTKGTSITAADNTRDTVTIRGASNVTLDGLDFNGGEDGVSVVDGGAATVIGGNIGNVTAPTDDGIAVANSSHVRTDGAVVKGTDDGISVQANSSATITNETSATGTDDAGLAMTSSSSASVSDSTLTGGRRGALVASSRLNLSTVGGANTLNGGGAFGEGVFCSQYGALRCGRNQTINAFERLDAPGPGIAIQHCTTSRTGPATQCP